MPVRKAANLLEYGLLVCIVAAAILIMQAFIKRGYQGGLKDSADRLGDQYSASSSATADVRTLKDNQVIVEETGTNASVINRFLPATKQAIGVVQRKALSYVDRSGNFTTIAMQKTGTLRNETYKRSGYTAERFQNFSLDSEPTWN